MLLDTEGYAIPFSSTDDDQVIEYDPSDPDFGPAESWPDWTDADRFEPSADDEDWRQSTADDDWQVDADEQARWSRRIEELIEAFEPSDQDWDDYAQWSGALTDQDIQAAGLPCG
jgi:hypothetical protein